MTRLSINVIMAVLSLVSVGGVDVDQRRNLPAHQLCLLCSLVLHRLGNLGDAHPSLSLPPPPETFQGKCVCV